MADMSGYMHDLRHGNNRHRITKHGESLRVRAKSPSMTEYVDMHGSAVKAIHVVYYVRIKVQLHNQTTLHRLSLHENDDGHACSFSTIKQHSNCPQPI
jgi:hypothetical protein